MKTKRLAVNAMLAAMCAVLGYIALDMNSIKVTFESLPVLLGALLFGPIDGMLIGGIGTFIYQLLRYGITATTLLWILPYVVCGLIVGSVSKAKNFSLSKMQTIVLVAISELVITALNTGVIYVDSKMYGYYYPALIVGALGIRIVICVVKAIIFGVVLPWLTNVVRRSALRATA